MDLRFLLLFTGLLISLSSCFSREPVKTVPMKDPETSAVTPPVPAASPTQVPQKDKSLDILVRYFEQADAIHREAWWVLTDERRPVGKSPFGKIQRALLSSQNIKLTNKSLFRCDRYVVKRDILGLQGFPQNLEVFEKCSEKLPAKLMARLSATDLQHVQAIFYPESLEEVLGLGASVVNKPILCEIKGGDKGQLLGLNCKDWAQERTKEQMIRLDTYEYAKEGQNIIKLRGKVFENLSDTRKIVADVPMEGKIEVLETELYPPVEETPKPTPVPLPSPAKLPTLKLETPEMKEPGITPLPPPRDQVVDPDVLMQQQQQQEQQQLQPSPQDPPQPMPETEGVIHHGR